MISWSLQAEVAEIHREIDRLQARGRNPEREEIEALRSRLREIEQHLGISRIIS